MATGSVLFSPGAATLPDGSASNAAPALTRFQGTQATKKVHMLALGFDGSGSTIEAAWWTFRMPTNYSSGGSLKLDWSANATGGTVKWQAAMGAITPADADTPLEHAFGGTAFTSTAVDANEAYRLVVTS